MVEEGWLNGEITGKIAYNYLKPLKDKKIDTLILGCTHYPLLLSVIKEVLGEKVKIINPAESLAKELKIFLNKNPKDIKKGNNHYFFFSDEPYNFNKISKSCLKKEIKIKVKDPFL